MSGRKARETRRGQAPAPRKRQSAKSRRWLWPALAIVVAGAVAGGVLAARGTGPAQALHVSGGGTVALSGPSPITGQQVSLDQFAGRPVVLNAWGSWCTGCRAEARDLARFVAAHPDVQVVGLDSEDTSGGARSFYREFGWQHPSIADPSGALAAKLGVQGFPTTFFLDRRHRIVTRIVGATDLAGFEQGARAIRSAAT
jgi:thiol-disulfide isomerase/thioredoxin